MKSTLSRRIVAALAVSAAIFGVVPAGTANAAQSCHWSFTTGKHGCAGSAGVRSSSDVVGGRIFSGSEYAGAMLTLWVPKPCSGNRYSLTLTGSAWNNSVYSGQAWSTCKLWLHQSNGQMHGPFTGNAPDLAFAAPYVTKISLT